MVEQTAVGADGEGVLVAGQHEAAGVAPGRVQVVGVGGQGQGKHDGPGVVFRHCNDCGLSGAAVARRVSSTKSSSE